MDARLPEVQAEMGLKQLAVGNGAKRHPDLVGIGNLRLQAGGQRIWYLEFGICLEFGI